eukprot:7529356-Lingulodinium_polyedra.AAC.1
MKEPQGSGGLKGLRGLQGRQAREGPRRAGPGQPQARSSSLAGREALAQIRSLHHRSLTVGTQRSLSITRQDVSDNQATTAM